MRKYSKAEILRGEMGEEARLLAASVYAAEAAVGGRRQWIPCGEEGDDFAVAIEREYRRLSGSAAPFTDPPSDERQRLKARLELLKRR